MTILGITWNKSTLVSFDPNSGLITEKHAWLDPKENFVGLAYDYKVNMLYALSQVSQKLYSINPLTRDVKLLGQLNTGGNDVSGLTYNPITGNLNTLILLHDAGNTNLRSQLAAINPNTLQVSVIGTIPNTICGSLCWRDSDGKFNAYMVRGEGAWDSPLKASIVTLDPATAAMTAIFETPYHAIMGLAKKSGQNAYYSAVNYNSHFYADVNLDTKKVTQLGSSDTVDVASAAMIARTFYVAPAPNLPCYYSDGGSAT